MNPRNLVLGIGAFVGGLAVLVGGAIAADRYAARRGEGGDDGADGPDHETAAGEASVTPPSVTLDTGRASVGGEAAVFGAVTASGDPATPANDPPPQPPVAFSGHVPTDLLGDARPGSGRAPTAFRPDMDAPMTPAEREALRPATGPGPSLVSGIPNVAEEIVRPAN